MLQIATALPTVSTGPARPVLLAAHSGTSNFALALSSLLLPGAAPTALPGETSIADTPAPGLQIAAEPGKELPEIGRDLSGDEEAPEQNSDADDDASANEDLPFAWFALPASPAADAAPITQPVIAPKAIVAKNSKAEVTMPEAVVPDMPIATEVTLAKVASPTTTEIEAAPLVASVAPKGKPVPQRLAERPVAMTPSNALPVDTDASTPAVAPVVAPVTPAPAGPAPGSAAAAPAPDVPVTVQPPLAATVASATPLPAPRAAPVRETAPVATETPAPRIEVAAPTAQPPRAPVAEPAQPTTIASLIAQASVQSVSQPIAFTPLRRSLSETAQPAVTSVAAPSAAILQQVTATPDAQQGTLDMRRQEWTGKMVEMIEAMREAAPVKETRISLVPDALGKVDISVRQDGDRVHVHFAAETQAARQILTDAQPRLTELAEARGIRLGQTSVDSQGAGTQSGQRQNDAQRPQNPSAPASARAAKDQLTATDDRVA